MHCGKELLNACMGAEILLLCINRLKASHHLAHRLDMTNPCERNKNQTMQYTAETLHDTTASTATTLSS